MEIVLNPPSRNEAYCNICFFNGDYVVNDKVGLDECKRP